MDELDKAMRAAEARADDAIKAVNVEGQVANATGIYTPYPGLWSFLQGNEVIREVEDIPAWWSPQRDRALQEFWRDGSYLASVVARATDKLASMPLIISPRDDTVETHAKQAEMIQERIVNGSEFANGFKVALEKFVQDYLTTDNGAFMEVIGEGEPDGPITGTVYGLRHLDSFQCQRTGDPVYPVLYRGEDGLLYKFHWTRLISMAQSPSGRRMMHGVGYCSISKALLIATGLKSTQLHKMRKMGTMPAQRIVWANNMTGSEILKMMVASQEVIGSLGLQGLESTVVVGGNDVNMGEIDLTKFDQYDEEKQTHLALIGLALAFGLEFNELFPEATSRQSDVIALQRARGLLPSAFISAFEQQFNTRVLPPHLMGTLDFRDDQQDHQRAVIEDIYARQYHRMVTSGTLPPEAAWRDMYRRGVISREEMDRYMLADNKLPDGMPIQTVFYSPRHSSYVLIDHVLLIPEINDREFAMINIKANRAALWLAMAYARNNSERKRILQVLAALDWLMGQYQFAQDEPDEVEVSRPQEEEESEEEQEEEEAESTTTSADPTSPRAGNAGGEDQQNMSKGLQGVPSHGFFRP